MNCICRICGSEYKGKMIKLNGICFGAVGSWDYFKCENCGCFQIKEIPDNLQDFYDLDGYYSLNTSTEGFRIRMWDHLFKYQVKKRDFLGKLISIVFPCNYKFMRNVPMDVSIIDVGCGDGQRLRQLQKIGFKNLFGLEPYIKEEITYSSKGRKISIFKGSLDDPQYIIDRKFDYVIFEHSFEHVCDENIVLKRAKELLNPGGHIVIKIPQFSNHYWAKFGVDQIQFDPPRHIYIHTYESMKFLAEKYGMEIVSYSTETEPTEYVAARSIRKKKTAGIKDIPIFQLLLYGVFTYPERNRLDKIKDGAYATFVLCSK